MRDPLPPFRPPVLVPCPWTLVGAVVSKRVEVEWIDSMLHEPEWQDVEDAIVTAKSDSPVQWTCGYLIHETEEHLLVALSRNDSGTRVSCVVTIPKRAIIGKKVFASVDK